LSHIIVVQLDVVPRDIRQCYFCRIALKDQKIIPVSGPLAGYYAFLGFIEIM